MARLVVREASADVSFHPVCLVGVSVPFYWSTRHERHLFKQILVSLQSRGSTKLLFIHLAGSEHRQRFCNSDLDLGKLCQVLVDLCSASTTGLKAIVWKAEIFDCFEGRGVK